MLLRAIQTTSSSRPCCSLPNCCSMSSMFLTMILNPLRQSRRLRVTSLAWLRPTGSRCMCAETYCDAQKCRFILQRNIIAGRNGALSPLQSPFPGAVEGRLCRTARRTKIPGRGRRDRGTAPESIREKLQKTVLFDLVQSASPSARQGCRGAGMERLRNEDGGTTMLRIWTGARDGFVGVCSVLLLLFFSHF